MRLLLGTVRDNQDPESRGRLRIVCPALHGETAVLPSWISPRVVGSTDSGIGFFWIPIPGAVVYLEEDDDGDLRWLGSELGSRQQVPELFLQDYPERCGFTTPDGSHAVVLGSSLGVLIQHGGGAKLEILAGEVNATQGGAAIPVLLSSLGTPLANALTQILAALSALALPATDVASLIANLQASAYDSDTLKGD